MPRQQSERWWAVTLNGVVALIVGVVTLLWPGITLGALIVIFGIFTLADGVLGLGALLFGARRVGPWWLRLLGSLLSIAAGLIALLWPGITSLALLWLVAAWALAKGILQIVIAVRYREHLARTWLLVLAGAVSLILGIVYVLFPGAGILSLVWLLGIFAIVYGGALIARGLLLRDVNRAFKGEARADT